VQTAAPDAVAPGLGPGVRVLSAPEGRGRLARARFRWTVEVARRRSDAPVVIYTEASGLAPADVSEAVWAAYCHHHGGSSRR
jgi:hypothetical protein